MILKSFKSGNESNIPDISGLYYFYENDRLLYVGKALTLKGRITQHRDNNQYALQWIKGLEDLIFPIFDRNDVDTLLKHEKLFSTCYGILSSVQRIDLAYHRVNRIEIEEMPHDLTKDTEQKRILELKPPFNNETRTWDKIDEMIDKCDEINSVFLKKWENVHR